MWVADPIVVTATGWQGRVVERPGVSAPLRPSLQAMG